MNTRWEPLAVWLLALPRQWKVALVCLADISAAALALLLVRLLTTPGAPLTVDTQTAAIGITALGVTATACWLSGAYSAVTRYTDSKLLTRVSLAAAASGVAILLVSAGMGILANVWNLVIIYALLCATFLGTWRLTAARILGGPQPEFRGEPVAIYGAGSAGRQLVAALQRGDQYRPIAFVDDRADIRGRRVQGLQVLPSTAVSQLKVRGITRVLLAMPSVSRARRKQLLEAISESGLQVMVMPGMDEIAEGSKRVDELREVQIEDLLGRDPVPPDPELLHAQIRGKTVLVTGAGGSIGSELARQAFALGATKLLLVEACEYALYEIDRQLRKAAPAAANACEVVPVLANVCDERHLRALFAEHAVDTVYHAAAYKHVPLVEANSISAAHNNINGTERTARTALQAGVQNFVLVSTDKAVRPTSIMGATKRFCEQVVQSLAQEYPDRSLSMVRFGNVLGSSGSVVPLFREQIRSGGPITVTHPDVTRYFMTIPEAASLVIQAGAMGNNGEVFVLDMGECVRIRDLATRMVQLCGLTLREEADPPETGDIAIRYTGLRPGEKLFEELLIGSDPVATTHSRIMKANERTLTPEDLREAMEKMRQAIEWRNPHELVAMLARTVNGFRDEPEQGEAAAQNAPKPAAGPQPVSPGRSPARQPA